MLINEFSPAQLKVLRMFAGHKQESLAAALGCSVSTIRNLEQGRTRIAYAIDDAKLRAELKVLENGEMVRSRVS